MCWVERQDPAYLSSQHRAGDPTYQASSMPSPSWYQGEHSQGPSASQEDLGHAMLPRSWTEVKLARCFSPALPAEVLFNQSVTELQLSQATGELQSGCQ